MTPSRATGPPTGTGRSLRRPFLVGAVAGFLGTLPVVYLALLVPGGEVAASLLLPGVHVLRAVLGEAPATWPGWVTLLLACTANALAWGSLAAGLVALLRAARR